jgi:hypothetical protein
VISRNWANLGSASWRSNLGEKVNVGLVVFTPLTRKIVFVIDSLNWANGLTRTAVDTFIRVDVQHAVALVDAVDWALIDTCFVLDVHAR